MGNVDNNGWRDLIISAGDQAADLYHHRFTRREGSSLSVYVGCMEQLDLMGIPAKDLPRLHWLVDPVDYSKPIVFDADNQAWVDPAESDILSGYCKAEDIDEPAPITMPWTNACRHRHLGTRDQCDGA